MIEDSGQPGRPIGDYLRVIKRRWWIVAATVVVVTAATYGLSSLQAPAYQATADDLITVQDIFNQNGSSSKDAAFYAATQAALADNVDIARAAIAAAKISNLTPQKLLSDSSVTADPTTSVVEFKVTYKTRAGAIALANAYGTAFAQKTDQQLTAKVQKLISVQRTTLTRLNTQVAAVLAQIARDHQQGLSATEDHARQNALDQQIASVQRTITDLQQAAATGVGGAKLQNPSASASQLAPNTVRNSIVGFLLGIAVGIGLAFLREAFDTRVHSADEAAAMLGLPLIGRLPRPARELRRTDRLALMVDPGGHGSEAYRKLRVSLDFANLDPQAKVILTTSALPQEGKSTTAANLAIAMASAGKRVILVDLDLRAPYMDRFFGVTGRAGLTHVVLGQVALDDALVPVVVPPPAGPPAVGNGGSPQPQKALLHVLPAGDAPSDPSSLLSSQRLAALLDELRGRADAVIVDTPPVLPVSDTLSLLALADGYLVVSRLDLVRRKPLQELRRELERGRAVGLGAIVTDADSDSAYAYGYGHGYGSGGSAQRAATRAGAG